MSVRLSLALAVAALLLASSAVHAQETSGTRVPPASSEDVKGSSSEDGGRDNSPSLDRIRQRLAGPAPVRMSLDQEPTFRIQIEERRHMLELARSLQIEITEVDTRPPPPGGVYGYEHQRIAMAALDRDRMEPYAAFSGPEFVTLAVESLLVKYLGTRAWNAITDSERQRAEAAAREEVALAIRQYCAQQPGYGVGIEICSDKIRP
jgi:hypothetical protein